MRCLLSCLAVELPGDLRPLRGEPPPLAGCWACLGWWPRCWSYRPSSSATLVSWIGALPDHLPRCGVQRAVGTVLALAERSTLPLPAPSSHQSSYDISQAAREGVAVCRSTAGRLQHAALSALRPGRRPLPPQVWHQPARLHPIQLGQGGWDSVPSLLGTLWPQPPPLLGRSAALTPCPRPHAER